ncbi:MAG TPA: NAD(P)H-hydrate dehydratase [Bacteroidia bacterium]|nr:NAD(P)H-hydrate dehydratase [Bacteroidia bacterium]
MQKILSIQQIRDWDAYTILNEPISSIDLMERAASKVSEIILSDFNFNDFEIYCGQGNNGGDGLVLARLLAQQNKKVKVYILIEKDHGSIDFELNLNRLKEIDGPEIYSLQSKLDFVKPSLNACIIDAILGTGIHGTSKGLTKDTIDYINSFSNLKIAIDVPSGLQCDEPLQFNASVVEASYTLTFQSLKLAFLFTENHKYCGIVKVLDIGLKTEFLSQQKSNHLILTLSNIIGLLPTRKTFAHKGNFGHALLLCGSSGKFGAAILSAMACSRSGAGLVTLHSGKKIESSLNSTLPSAMFNADENDELITQIPNLDKFTSVAMGCGAGMATSTISALKLLIQQCKVPLVLDADALNILAQNKTWLSFLPPGTILTPHPKEFERLFGKWNNSFERLQMQKDFSRKYNCYIVLKGAYTCVSTPSGNCYFNPTGNAGMAKGGSGDVLTGIITALLSQGLNRTEACLVGVFVHGLAGDLAKEYRGEISMLPEDLIENLGKAFKKIEVNY